MSHSPAIAIAAYKRSRSLTRLLDSLANADYTGYSEIVLIISIDRSDSQAALEVAQKFEWQYGEKKLVHHSRNLGLKRNVLFCGDLSDKYGSVIVLEDDLYVARNFYGYTCQALEYYQNSTAIAGISLYAYCYNEYAKTRFIPVDDGYDNYFFQSASSWGQAWTRTQWQGFRQWYEIHQNTAIGEGEILPARVISWLPERSWKQFFIRYMVAANKYFVVPRISLSTNFAEVGDHITSVTNNYQSPLLIGKKNWNFSHLDESKSIYDVYFEMTPNCLKKNNPYFEQFDLECDLYGTKQLDRLRAKHTITIRNAEDAIASFDLRLIPHELNLIYQLEGSLINLVKTDSALGLSYRKKMLQQVYLNHNAGIIKYGALFINGMLNRILN